MSPYQQDVIDTSLAEFDKQRQIAQQQLGNSSCSRSLWPRSRTNCSKAEFAAQSLQDRALLEAQLRQQGFQQAQQAAAQAQAQQAGLASLQPSLAQSQIQQLGAAGTSNLAYQQAILDAASSSCTNGCLRTTTKIRILRFSNWWYVIRTTSSLLNYDNCTCCSNSWTIKSSLSGAATIYGLGSLFGR
jgi:hypothetical protein